MDDFIRLIQESQEEEFKCELMRTILPDLAAAASLYSASLIKAFVMAKTYEDMEQVKADEAKKLNTADTKTVDVKLNDLLWNMITVSDNESCNELVKLQTDSLDFKKGAEDINKYLEKEGYTETSVQHTLHPAASAQESLGGRNMTSVKDCGTLLEDRKSVV